MLYICGWGHDLDIGGSVAKGPQEHQAHDWHDANSKLCPTKLAGLRPLIQAGQREMEAETWIHITSL